LPSIGICVPKRFGLVLGGSFDIWAGIKSRAPGWLRDNHLEWLYRLYQEPWRWRRMMALPHFALKAIGQRLKQVLSFADAPAR
jgi:N-acetylglucosaminyldiphosphoundecaprenol N-acetyl-beta-D-mannosaminyltransferase